VLSDRAIRNLVAGRGWSADKKDVGYITLPDGRRFAIAVFTSSSQTSASDRDRAIAEIARSLFDYFLIAPKAMR